MLRDEALYGIPGSSYDTADNMLLDMIYPTENIAVTSEEASLSSRTLRQLNADCAEIGD